MREAPGGHNNRQLADAQRDKVLRSLHPDQVRKRERRRRWAWVTAFLVLTVGLFVLTVYALRAQSWGVLILSGLLFCLSLFVFVALLCMALVPDIVRFVRRGR